ncbi:sugar nucleotidyltransferase [Helicobacter monodelphidis]|uniref:phosphocholine cytidylyltransferase family protein n=1 Tax=Helicobacter sp. 15-1451 TaxID=2004995 RepID=UPI000DCF5CB8|nr:phosphocholine cytidylyltransferase family protein [Helicobacter sp. 15-1451]RAX57100.1 sugar nucleotidyltransferase [Helicobacter sp. 15-1451]
MSTQALILAAGFGSRLMPLTQTIPKCMVKYRGHCIIDYEIQALEQAGIKHINVVGGYLYETLEQYLQKKFHIQHFFRNPNYQSTNMVTTFFCARELLEFLTENNDDLIVSYADIVYSKTIVQNLLEADGDFKVIVDKQWKRLWEKRFDDPLSDAETLKLDKGIITEIGKKPISYDDIHGQYIGLFYFSSSFLKKVLSFYDSLDTSKFYDGKDIKNMYMTSLLQGLIEKYQNARAVEIQGGWCEIDFKSDLDIVIELQ